MSGLKKHKDLTNIHRVQCFEYADAATRAAATGFVPADIGKVARDIDTNCFWVLVDDDPATWEEITNKTIPPDTDIKVAVSASDTTAGFLFDELTVSVGTNPTAALEKSITNPGFDEKLNIQLDPDRINTDRLVAVDSGDTAGELETKLVAGANISITKTGPVGNRQLEISTDAEISQDCPAVQVRRTTDQTFTGTYTDVTFDQTDVETEPGTIEHDNTNTDRIQLKETGLYRIHYHSQTNINSQGVFNYRVRANDTDVIDGSMSFREDGGDTFPNGLSFSYEATAGDFISLQIQNSGGSGVLEAPVIMTVEKCAGAKGDKGDTGSGSSITLQADDVTVPGGPHDTLNFSDDFTVTDNGSGKATVDLATPVSVFGSEYAEAESLGESSTGSATFQNKVSLVTGVVPAGRYRVGYSYRWRHSSTSGDFNARIEENNTTERMYHQQEPQDSGTNQAHRVGGFFNTTLTNASHQFDLDFREQSGGTAFISEARLEFWRIS